MSSIFVRNIKSLIHKFGFDIVKHSQEERFPLDFDNEIIEVIRKVKPFTQTSPERIYSLCEATKYIVNNQIPGAIVECGVWKGGSIMAVAQILINLNEIDRELYLFDTFEGMSAPSQEDIDISGVAAIEMLDKSDKQNSDSIWCYASLEEVKNSVYGIGYNSEKICFIKGKVEDTIPGRAPQRIALLRLDTDWYESTKHELIHLFPRISPGGVIIVDDYGHWQGARQAVDEYIKDNKIKLLLNRIDYTGRIGVVVG